MTTDISARARVHAALGEKHRLQIVDALRLSDRAPSELQAVTGLGSNLLAFHLDVLDEAGLIERRRSQGDARRRYVTLRWDALTALEPRVEVPDGPVLFVCSRNAARSQLAAALWQARTGRPSVSAGTHPAERVDQFALEVARDHGLDLSNDRPRSYHDIDQDPGLVVSVCDRARESGLPWVAPQLHWSVPDPVQGRRGDYETAYADLRGRVNRLAAASDRAA